MKKILLFAIMLLATFSAFSQMRVNKEKIPFISESKKITKAIGWQYSEYNGKWYDNQNFIAGFNTNVFDSKYYKSQSEDNFNWFQWKTINFNSSTYYVLIINYLTGQYKYKYIQEGWFISNFNRAFIYEKSEYDKLKSDSVNVVLSPIDFCSCLKESSLLNDIVAALERCKQYNKTALKTFCQFPIKLQVDGDGSLIRFLLPNNEDAKIEMLDKQYYEMKKIDFMKILIN